MDDASFKGDSAEVTSALPLTDKEQESVKKEVLAKSGAKDIAFHVDPSILGGLVVKIGDKVLDGSVSGAPKAFVRHSKNRKKDLDFQGPFNFQMTRKPGHLRLTGEMNNRTNTINQPLIVVTLSFTIANNSLSFSTE